MEHNFFVVSIRLNFASKIQIKSRKRINLVTNTIIYEVKAKQEKILSFLN